VNVLQNRNQDYFPQFAAVPVQVIALDEVEVNESAPPLTVRIGPLLRIIIGLAAGVGLAILAEYLDTTIHSRAEVEALGLQVVAEIPPEH
jgi:capsular polysaccharide biosynthesis protein